MQVPQYSPVMRDDWQFDPILYLRVLQRRKWLLLLPIVFITGLVAAASMLLPNEYQSQALAIVRQEEEAEVGLAVPTSATQQVTGVVDLLSSQSTQTVLAQQLEAERPPELNEQEAVADFQRHLTMRIEEAQRGAERAVFFVYEGHPLEYTVAVVNAFAREFERLLSNRIRDRLYESLRGIEDELGIAEEELGKLRDDEERLEARLTEYLGDLATATEGEKLDELVATNLARDQEEIEMLGLELSSLQSQVNYLRNQLTRTPATLAMRPADLPDQTRAMLESQLAQARAQRINLLSRYTEEHPEVKAIQQQVRDLESRVAEVRRQTQTARDEVPNPAYDNLQQQLVTLESQLEYSRARRERLQARAAELRRAAAALPEIQQSLRRVREDMQAKVEAVITQKDRREQLETYRRFEESRTFGRIELQLDEVSPTDIPIRPNRRRFIILAFLASLVLGISFVLLAEYLDKSVRTEEELKRYIDAPIVTVLPRTDR